MTQSKTYAVVSRNEAELHPYPYVYVEDDGTVRELHEAERHHLEKEFSPFDGGRPYVKESFDARDGWGSTKGFCHRKNVPENLTVAAAPEENPNPPMTKANFIALLKQKATGFRVVEKPDGTVEMNRVAKES